MTRGQLIERLRRQVYGGFPFDDSQITDNLVNQWINDGLGIAAKQNYKDNIQLDGVGVVNNSFYSTFKGITIVKDEEFLYKLTLPNIPLGIGTTDGISRVVLKDKDGKISFPVVLLSEGQVGIQRSMRPVQNKTMAYPEGGDLFILTTLLADQYNASVTLISGGDINNLDSILNIPDDYILTVVEYVKAQLNFERNMPQNVSNDGADIANAKRN